MSINKIKIHCYLVIIYSFTFFIRCTSSSKACVRLSMSQSRLVGGRSFPRRGSRTLLKDQTFKYIFYFYFISFYFILFSSFIYLIRRLLLFVLITIKKNKLFQFTFLKTHICTGNY